MSYLDKNSGPGPHTQLAGIQEAASRLIPQLCDRSAYASREEFEEIRSLVKALREFCGSAGQAQAGA